MLVAPEVQSILDIAYSKGPRKNYALSTMSCHRVKPKIRRYTYKQNPFRTGTMKIVDLKSPDGFEVTHSIEYLEFSNKYKIEGCHTRLTYKGLWVNC